MELAPNPFILEVAKALGGSFKLVTLAPKPVREMTQLVKETQKNGDTNKSKRQINTQDKVLYCYAFPRYESSDRRAPT